MKDNSTAPFKVGQRVVCIKSHSLKIVVKGNTYPIKGLSKCKCGSWSVDIGEIISKKKWDYLRCYGCGVLEKNEGTMWFASALFAPIQEQYTDATAEIIEKFKQTDEVPDKSLIPEIVNN